MADLTVSANVDTLMQSATFAAFRTSLGIDPANEATDTTCFPLFVTAATGTVTPKTNAAFLFNSATGAIDVTSLDADSITATTATVTTLVGTVQQGVSTLVFSGNVNIGAALTTVGAFSTATAFSTTGHTLTTNGVTYTLPGVTASLAPLTSPSFTTPSLGVATATSIDTALLAPTAHVVEQRNGTNGQSFYIYNSWASSGTVYSRLGAYWSGGTAFIATQSNSGISNLALNGLSLYFQTGGNSRWICDSSGHFLPNNTNTVDIGSSGTIVRAGYFGNITASGNLITATQTPASAAAAGTAGTIAYDATYFYVCLASGTWRRVAHASW